jgi:hypothetical protein
MIESADSLDKAVKISNPERVDRILRKISSASIEVLIRVAGSKSVAVRGRAAEVDTANMPHTFRICNISDAGIAHLQTVDVARIEFIGMTTQVVFDGRIITRDHGSIAIEYPTALFSLERRENARFVATPSNMSFVNLGCWSINEADITAPPVIYPFVDLASWISIADISEGGFCAVTRFPAPINALRRGTIDDHAKIIFPMQPHIPVALEIRWFKRIKDRVRVEGSTRFQRTYRFGAQFVNQSDDAKLAVKQYIQQLSVAEAI